MLRIVLLFSLVLGAVYFAYQQLQTVDDAILSASTSLIETMSGTSPVMVNPLPAPVSINWGKSGPLRIMGLKLEGTDNKVIKDAVKRTWKTVKSLQWVPQAVDRPFKPLTRPQDGVVESLNDTGSATPVRKVHKIHFSISEPEVELQLGVDESYTLKTEDDQIIVGANTVWGALHALTTLQQLIISDEQHGLIIEQDVSIADKPDYPHRGLMIDSGRHFLTVESILRQIDGLALSKMNVLHWHLVDAQSWALELESVPEMINGAYSKKERYSKKDVKKVVDYAYARGVRVIPEVDSPGHSYRGWAEVDPELLACATSRYSNNVNNFQLDIMNPAVYNYVEKVHDEISDMFKDNLFHVGADELENGCFEFSKYIQEWFAEDPSRDYDDLLEQWFDKALPIFTKKSDRRVIMWEDSVLSTNVKATNIPKNVIMQNWNNGTEFVPKLVKMGHDVIVSDADFFYLDCGFGAYRTGKIGTSWCDPFKDWQRIYSFNFTDFGLTEEEHSKVLGAEAALWSEVVDSTTIDQKVWPRLAALGELLWSGNKDKNGSFRLIEMGMRIANFRELLVELGIQAPPLQPKFCIQNPHDCDNDIYLSHV